MKKFNVTFLVAGLLIMIGAMFVGTLNEQSSSDLLSDPVTWLVIVAAFFLLIALIATWNALDAMKYMLMKKEGKLPVEETEEEEEAVEDKLWLQSILEKLQDARPIEEEADIDLDHDYDGIRELDNNLPPWWVYGFYITIIFAVVYIIRTFTGVAPDQFDEYQSQLVEAEKIKAEYLKTAANLVDESNVVALTDESRLLSGKAIFDKNCAVCHQTDGGGGVGPNLTDIYWLHGGSIKDVFTTVKYGVPAKGMIPWKDQLNPSQMQEVSSYILTLQGTTPANPKDPQGDAYEPVQEEETTEEMTTDSTATPADTTAAEEAVMTSL